jgi:TPR repeat protein
MRHSVVPKILCICALVAGLQACADDDVLVVAPDQNTFDQGTAAFDAGDYPKAFAIFKDLASNGDIAAERNVALMERKGLGTGKDPKAALADYTDAATKGLPTAQSDLAAALPWLERAAAASHPMAQFHLGQLYEQGKGVPKDLDKAELLYAAAAAHGVKEAVERLSALKSWPKPGDPEAAPPPTVAASP